MGGYGQEILSVECLLRVEWMWMWNVEVEVHCDVAMVLWSLVFACDKEANRFLSHSTNSNSLSPAGIPNTSLLLREQERTHGACVIQTTAGEQLKTQIMANARTQNNITTSNNNNRKNADKEGYTTNNRR